jgi:hypothetical protein
MDVCGVLYKDSTMKDKIGLHSTKNGSKGNTPGINTKENAVTEFSVPTNAGNICIRRC